MQLSLTRRDREVLAILNSAVGIRAITVAAAMQNRRLPGPPRDVVSWDAQREARLTLRGAEHLGLVEQRGGWWRITPAGQAALDAGSVPA